MQTRFFSPHVPSHVHLVTLPFGCSADAPSRPDYLCVCACAWDSFHRFALLLGLLAARLNAARHLFQPPQELAVAQPLQYGLRAFELFTVTGTLRQHDAHARDVRHHAAPLGFIQRCR